MPLVAAYSDSEGDSDNDSAPRETLSVAHGLSKPNQKDRVTDELSAAPIEPTEEILEEFVKKVDYDDQLPEKPKAASSFNTLRVKGKKSGRIQISIPDILDSDDSPDDDSPAPKVQKLSNGSDGLLGSLPQPRNVAAGKETNRKLIPQSITRPPAPASKTIKKAKSERAASKRPLGLLAGSDESDDPDTGSTDFFSMEKTESTPKPASNFFELEGDIGHQAGQSYTANIEAERTAQPTAASLYNLAAQSEDVEYNSIVTERSEKSDGMQNIINSEEFLRMQGKKHRGNEDIQLIDVNTDDLKATELEITKNLSQDVDPSMYEHRKTMNLSGQEKRKHQITYLAYQAKEREIELKNTWADNRHTKKQTQAKYGF